MSSAICCMQHLQGENRLRTMSDVVLDKTYLLWLEIGSIDLPWCKQARQLCRSLSQKPLRHTIILCLHSLNSEATVPAVGCGSR